MFRTVFMGSLLGGRILCEGQGCFGQKSENRQDAVLPERHNGADRGPATIGVHDQLSVHGFHSLLHSGHSVSHGFRLHVKPAPVVGNFESYTVACVDQAQLHILGSSVLDAVVESLGGDAKKSVLAFKVELLSQTWNAVISSILSEPNRTLFKVKSPGVPPQHNEG